MPPYFFHFKYDLQLWIQVLHLHLLHSAVIAAFVDIVLLKPALSLYIKALYLKVCSFQDNTQLIIHELLFLECCGLHFLSGYGFTIFSIHEPFNYHIIFITVTAQ